MERQHPRLARLPQHAIEVDRAEAQRVGQKLLRQRQPAAPFRLLGFDIDDDTVFLNETIRDWCETAAVEFTRSRLYRENDQAHVEGKNGEVVRRMLGYRRYVGLAAARDLARIHREPCGCL